MYVQHASHMHAKHRASQQQRLPLLTSIASLLLAATVREMFTAGVAAAYTGVPLHMVLICKGSIEAAFGGAKIIQREPVKNLLLVRGTDLHHPAVPTPLLAPVLLRPPLLLLDSKSEVSLCAR